MDRQWIKSSYSYSNGNCVEVGWHKAKASNYNGACVEAGSGACGMVHVRDSKNPEGAVLSFPPRAWEAFLAGVKAGEMA